MQDLFGMLGALKRPPLLVRAARFGVHDYDRNTILPRLLRVPSPPRTGPALMRLLEMEEQMEERRKARGADYSVARHVELVIAIMGEARLLKAASRPEPVS